MARPWQPRLLVFAGLHEKAQVKLIARLADLGTDAVVGKLIRVWLEFQAKADDNGVLAGRTAAWLDLVAGCEGFAFSMSQAGWLSIQNDRLVVSNFDEFISKRAIRRMEEGLRLAGKRAAESADPAGHNAGIEQHRSTQINKVPVGPVAPKVRRSKTQAAVTDPRFWTFYNLYPKQHGQKKAWDEWAALAPDDALVEVILKAVKAQLTWPQWTKQNGDFIPTPAKWLAGQHWDDKPVALGPGQRVQPTGRVPAEEGQHQRRRSYGEAEGGDVPPGTDRGLF